MSIKSNIPELNALLIREYLEYHNNYLTVEKYAEHRNLNPVLARDLLQYGYSMHEEQFDYQTPNIILAPREK